MTGESSIKSDTETLQGGIEQEEDDSSINNSKDIHSWLVVLATFLVLVVGLGAGTGW
jgi:hypothetical protein